MLSIITPIPNEASCYSASCHAHASGERKLGLLEVTMSLVRMDEEVRRNVLKTVLFDLALFAFITAVVVAYILFFVNRPITRLLLGNSKNRQRGPSGIDPYPLRGRTGKSGPGL